MWQYRADLFEYPSGLAIACLGETVHLVWSHDRKLYWRYADRGISWSKPQVISVRSGGSVDLVKDGGGLHLAWLQSTNIAYRYFDGQSWSTEERILKGEVPAGTSKLAIVNRRPVVFWTFFKHGPLPHTEGSWPLMFSQRDSSGWSEPASVPCATNVDRSFVVKPQMDGRINIAWIKKHRGYLTKKLGLRMGKAKRTLEVVTFEPKGGLCKSPSRLFTFHSDSSRDIKMASGPGNSLHVLWIDGYDTARAEWKSRVDGNWSAGREVRSARGGTMDADLATDAGGRVMIFSYANKRQSKLSLIFNAGTSREVVYYSPPGVGMWLQGVRIAVAPSGKVHVASDSGDYCCIEPVIK